MKLNFRVWFIAFAATLSLLGCTDHQLGGPSSPVRLRLKTVQDGSVLTTYTYDSQNRLAMITKADGGLSIYSYDDATRTTLVKQYPDPADQTTGFAALLPYSLDVAGAHTSYHSIVNSVIQNSPNDETIYYFVDAHKHVSTVNTQYGTGGVIGSYFSNYTYTGENITQESSEWRSLHLRDVVYEYDDKINPFFGSNDPNIGDIADLKRFSRNNVTKVTITSVSGLDDKTIVYAYEYNQQGLPMKRITQGSNEVINYTYESY